MATPGLKVPLAFLDPQASEEFRAHLVQLAGLGHMDRTAHQVYNHLLRSVALFYYVLFFVLIVIKTDIE